MNTHARTSKSFRRPFCGRTDLRFSERELNVLNAIANAKAVNRGCEAVGGLQGAAFACTCSGNCGSNYSQSGGCVCSGNCGSNYSKGAIPDSTIEQRREAVCA